MKTINKLILLSIASLFMASCASNAYKQGNWANTDTERDWDIDSAVCLQKSEKLDASDLERVQQIKKDNQTAQSTFSTLETANTSNSDLVSAISLLGTAFSTSEEIGAEDTVIAEKFANCLKDKSWLKIDG